MGTRSSSSDSSGRRRGKQDLESALHLIRGFCSCPDAVMKGEGLCHIDTSLSQTLRPGPQCNFIGC